MPWKLVEGLTTADVAFLAEGKGLNELFESAADALFDIMVDPKTVKKAVKQEVTITEKTIEKLLFNFLEEIIFLKDAESMLFSDCYVAITEKDGNYILNAALYGDAVNHERQALKVDAKAITMHKFSVIKEKEGYKAQVIVDI